MHGIYVDGGAVCNIVPETATARFYFRAPRRAYLNDLLERAYNAARGAALATETEVVWHNFELSFDELLPNDAAETMMEGIYEELGIVYGHDESPGGSSDLGNVSQRCPTLQPLLSIVDKPLTLHTREFAAATVEPLAHEAIVTGARILARASLKAFLEPDLRTHMHDALAQARNRKE